jgi:parallel beta helix pectate lyase-like protein
MSQRQRRRKAERRREAQQRGSSKRQVAAGATIAMGATLAATGSAQAATFTVTNLNDQGAGSLRQAIFDANNNGLGSDDIVFASGLTGTISVGADISNNLYPETPMSIQGPGPGQIALQAVNGVDSVFFTDADFGSSPGVPITISGVTITGGNADGSLFTDSGGGIYNRDAALTVSDTVISGNHADDDGGGIYSYSALGSVTVVNSTVSGNDATPTDASSYAGAIFSKYSDVTIRNSTIADNKSGGDGGAIYMSSGGGSGGSLSIENSTIANNASLAHGPDDEGGGVWIADFDGTNDNRLDIKSSTITGNSVGGSGGEGGGVYALLPASRVSIQNTIAANNTGTTGNDIYSYYGGQLGFSLVKDPSNSTGIAHSFTSTGPNINGVDPQLGGLANNGGATQTEAPSASSPVIDKGNGFGLNTDQRGVLRPIDFPAIPNAADGSDIGAVELQPSNAFKLGKLKRNKKKGTAKQVVILSVPDAGTVTITGKGLKTKTRNVTGAANVKLPVIAKGKKQKALGRSGKVKIKSQITYSPIGNALVSLKKKLKLLKK